MPRRVTGLEDGWRCSPLRVTRKSLFRLVVTRPEALGVLLGAPVGTAERPPDAQRLIDQILRGLVTDQDIYLVGPFAEYDVRRSAATGEAVEARPLHRYESFQRVRGPVGRLCLRPCRRSASRLPPRRRHQPGSGMPRSGSGMVSRERRPCRQRAVWSDPSPARGQGEPATNHQVLRPGLRGRKHRAYLCHRRLESETLVRQQRSRHDASRPDIRRSRPFPSLRRRYAGAPDPGFLPPPDEAQPPW